MDRSVVEDAQFRVEVYHDPVESEVIARVLETDAPDEFGLLGSGVVADLVGMDRPRAHGHDDMPVGQDDSGVFIEGQRVGVKQHRHFATIGTRKAEALESGGVGTRDARKRIRCAGRRPRDNAACCERSTGGEEGAGEDEGCRDISGDADRHQM